MGLMFTVMALVQSGHSTRTAPLNNNPIIIIKIDLNNNRKSCFSQISHFCISGGGFLQKIHKNTIIIT